MRSNVENYVLDLMYRGTTTIQDFCWDNLTTTPILCLMSPMDIDNIKKLILSPRYSGNNKLKMEKIDEIMHFRGFSRFAGGTNRLVYIHPSAPNAVFKVAIDAVGINDNPAEFRNQQYLKPYCCKVFECSPCGTIASFERVERITTFDEFASIADDYFYILSRKILGKYVMEDIGIDYFMNIGIRVGSHPVLLDFPYLFELNGDKLICSSEDKDGNVCNGEIDYDHGFNKLICKKCGKIYHARDLAKPVENGGILLRQSGGKRMKFELVRGNKVIKTYDSTIEKDYLSKNDKDVTNGESIVMLVREKSNKPYKDEHKPSDKRVVTNSPKKDIVIEKPVQKSIPVKRTITKPRILEIDIDEVTSTKSTDGIVTDTENIDVELFREETKKPEIQIDDVKDETVEIQTTVETEIDTEDTTCECKSTEESKAENSESTEETANDTVETVISEESKVEESKNEEIQEEVKEEVKPIEEVVESTPATEELKEEIQEEKPVEESVSDETSEEENKDELPTLIFVDKLPELSEVKEDYVVYCVKAKDDINITAYSDITDPALVDTDLFDFYVPMYNEDGKVDSLLHAGYDKDKNEWYSQEDDENLEFVKSLPTESEASDEVVYCLAKSEDIDIAAYEDVKNPNLVDKSLFEFYCYDGERFERLDYDSTNKTFIKYINK